MRVLTTLDTEQCSGGVSAAYVGTGAVLGGLAGLLPASEIIAYSAGMLPLVTFVTHGIPMILGVAYPYVLAGACIGAAVGAGIDYATHS